MLMTTMMMIVDNKNKIYIYSTYDQHGADAKTK